MNYTDLMKRIKRELGVMAWHLPMDDEEIIDIIKEEVMIPFSTFFPYEHRAVLDINGDNFDQKESIFTIPLDIYIPEGCQIISVKKINHSEVDASVGFSSYDGYMNRVYSGNMLDIMYDDIEGGMMGTLDRPAPTIDFIHPNKLKLYNYNALFTSKIEVVFHLTYPNLNMIPLAVSVFFNKLAVKTVQKFLYKVLKYRDQIDTAYGTINLRLDDWTDAEREVEEMMATLAEDQVLFSQNDSIWFTN